ncbi:DUF1669 domain-containing protein [Candidatus Acetothermia bacterium]|nr:DUF1669 domain-containing protein [Candidatus Acetothermia bacterium]
MLRIKSLGFGLILINVLALSGCIPCPPPPITVDAYFTWPGSNDSTDEPKQQIISHIDTAAKSIDAAVYVVSDPDIGRHLAEATHRNVTVRIVMDNNYIGQCYALANTPDSRGITFRKNKVGKEMHDKFAIFDGNSIITGSYNWSESADKDNFENIVVTNDFEVVRKYEDVFNRLWTDDYTEAYSTRAICP